MVAHEPDEEEPANAFGLELKVWPCVVQPPVQPVLSVRSPMLCAAAGRHSANVSASITLPSGWLMSSGRVYTSSDEPSGGILRPILRSRQWRRPPDRSDRTEIESLRPDNCRSYLTIGSVTDIRIPLSRFPHPCRDKKPSAMVIYGQC